MSDKRSRATNYNREQIAWLESHGLAMTIDELFAAFKVAFPTNTVQDTKALKRALDLRGIPCLKVESDGGCYYNAGVFCERAVKPCEHCGWFPPEAERRRAAR